MLRLRMRLLIGALALRNQLRALRRRQIAADAVYVDDAGAIGTVDVVGINAPSGWLLLCCARGKQTGIATKAAARVAAGADQAAALAALRSVAADCGVGLTPHQAVIQRALASVETANERIADLQKTAPLRDLNDEFNQPRKP